MTGDEVRQVFEARLPQAEIDRLCEPFGVIERQRKMHLGMLVRAMVIAAGTPGGAYQAAALRSSLECEVPSVARSACYRWFDAPLERFMAALAERALASARAPQGDRSGPLDGVHDWYSVASTTVRIRDALREECPGTGDDAAIQVQQVLSVGCGAPVRDHFSPAREHDRRHLTIEASWRGCGWLAALASASLDRLRACEAHEGRFVIRLQDAWTPKGDHLARGQVTQECCGGTDLDALLDDQIRILDGRAIDADGHVGQGQAALPRRRGGVHTATGSGFLRTHLPPRIGPRPVADRDRVRWEVERSIKVDTSVNRLDALDAERPCSLKTRLHASLMASTIAAILAHTHNLQTRPRQPGVPRTEAPLHPRRLALQLAVSCQSMAQAFDLKDVEAQRRWDKLAAILMPSGKDPNWRRRPSVLEQLRGWKRQPIARKEANSEEGSHGHVKAAA
jgi:hypothetical protein